MENLIPYKSKKLLQVRNEHCEEDIKFAISVIQLLLTPLGIWPNPEKKYLNYMKLTLWTSILIFTIVPSGLYAIFIEKDSILRLKLMLLLIYAVVVVSKLIALVAKNNSLLDCIQHLKKDWANISRLDDRQIMKNHAKVARKFSIVCVVFLFTAGFFYHTILPLATQRIVNNVTLRPLAYPTYNPVWDVQLSPAHEIVYTLHCFNGYLLNSITCSCLGAAAIFVLHACGQLQILISKLDRLVDGEDNVEDDGRGVEDRLADILEHHLRVLKLMLHINNALREVCLAELLGSTLLLCLILFYCATDYKHGDTTGLATYCIAFVSLGFNILLFCHIGELLTQQFFKFGVKVYMIEWYRLPKRIASVLVLIIAMSNCPPKLNAGLIFDMSLSTAGAIMKTSLAYFNFLQQTMT